MLESVGKTIGVEYESIVFDNRDKKYGICKVYNEAAKQAKGDYLCFVHEDVIIEANKWGKELIKFAEHNNDCGVIGIAGGKYANRNFIDWNVSERSVKVYDPWGSNKQHNLSKSDLILKYSNPNNELFSKAVCLDGVFLFVKKSIWENNKFDEETFKGFHCYDADFSFSISQKYQNHVYFGMDIYHFSCGNKEKSFCENIYLFQKKWKGKLPYCLPGYKISFSQELSKARGMLFLYRRNGFSMTEFFRRIYEINGLLFSIFFPVYYSLIICKKIIKYCLKGEKNGTKYEKDFV